MSIINAPQDGSKLPNRSGDGAPFLRNEDPDDSDSGNNHQFAFFANIKKTSPVLIVSLATLAFVNALILQQGHSQPRTLSKPTSGTPGVVYGLVHIAKTAGTTINGNLSMHYERVCGNKGYSYDAFETNKRFQEFGNHDIRYNSGDVYSQLKPPHNRGKVQVSIMDEIGYQDCDWISAETGWSFWPRKFQNWPIPMELHIPCRSPVDHLMSQCNFKRREFQCNKTGDDMIQEIEKCLISNANKRYSEKLHDTFPIKCFDSRHAGEYMEWIGTKLQKKRIETEYAFRASNRPRRKDLECVWSRPDVQEFIVSYLIENYPYYRFCDKCIGSDNDIFASLAKQG